MLKKVTVIILMLLYLIPVIGINGTVHYCGGEVASVTINGIGKSEKCGCGSKRMASDCCNDEDFSFQIENDQHELPQCSFNTLKTFNFPFAFFYQVYLNFKTTFTQKEIYNYHHSPNNVKTPLYILHQVFII